MNKQGISRRRGVRLLAVVAGAALAAVGAFAVTSGAAGESHDAVVEANEPSGSLPTVVRDMITERDGRTTYGVALSAARTVTPVGGDAVWVIPARGGAACIAHRDGATACADAEGVATGRLTLIEMPPPPREVGRALMTAQREGLSDAQTREAARRAASAAGPSRGAAIFTGLAPDETIRDVALVNPGDAVLARATTTERVYSLRIADVAVVERGAELRFEGAEGDLALTVPLR